jgi:hypothetical protein
MLCVKGNCVSMAGPFEEFHVKLMQSILDINDYDDLKPPSKLFRGVKQP